MDPQAALVLNYDNLSQSTADMFKVLAESPAAREALKKNPVGYILESVFPGTEAPLGTYVTATNRLLLSLLSNQGFMDWAKQYADAARTDIAKEFPDLSVAEREKIIGTRYTRARLITDTYNAISKNIDPQLLASILSTALAENTARDARALSLAAIPASQHVPLGFGPAEGVFFDNVAVIRNVVAVQNVLVVQNHVKFFDVVAGEILALAGIGPETILAATRVFTEDLMDAARQARAGGMLDQPLFLNEPL